MRKFSYSFLENEYVRFIYNEQRHWLKVEPVLWYVDSKANILISKNVLIRGIDCDFIKINNSNILEYMNDYMYKDIVSSAEVKNKVMCKK